MFKNAILVLLYNKEIFESSTINSLLKLGQQLPGVRLVIWNNGPNTFKCIDSSRLSLLGYNVIIKESLNNESLAVIYNQFIEGNKAERYIILDDDSALNEEYITASFNVKTDHIAMPIISFDGKVQSPSIDHKRYSKDISLTSKNRVLTIGSGLVIGVELINELKSFYGNVFDERFYLYDVDTTFCIRLYKAKLTSRIKIINGFEHSLSRLSKESPTTIYFRRVERSYALGLRFRYYTSTRKAIFLLLKAGLSTLKMKFIGKEYKVIFFHLLKAYISGRHYRKDYVRL